MYITSYKIYQTNQQDQPFVRLPNSQDEYFISISDGVTGLVAIFESKEEYTNFIKQGGELTGHLLPKKISCASGGGH